jgi:hypothetical protein
MNDLTGAQILRQAAGLDRMSEHPLARPSSPAPKRKASSSPDAIDYASVGNAALMNAHRHDH